MELTTEKIQKIVYNYFGQTIAEADENKKNQEQEYVQPRQISMYFAKQLTNDSLSKIGRVNGEKDHATALHSVRVVNNLIDTDKKFRQTIFDLENFIEKEREKMYKESREDVLLRIKELEEKLSYYKKLLEEIEQKEVYDYDVAQLGHA